MLIYGIRYLTVFFSILLGVNLIFKDDWIGYPITLLGFLYGFYVFYKDQLQSAKKLDQEIQENLESYGFQSLDKPERKKIEKELEGCILDVEPSFFVLELWDKHYSNFNIMFGKYHSVGPNFYTGWFVLISLDEHVDFGGFAAAFSSGRDSDLSKCLKPRKAGKAVIDKFKEVASLQLSDLKFFSIEIRRGYFMLSLDNYQQWEKNTNKDFYEFMHFLESLGGRLNA